MKNKPHDKIHHKKNNTASQGLSKRIHEIASDINNSASKKIINDINIMEVCGTHTMSIAKYNLRQLLPLNIHLISGPGCPVCVTPVNDIDWILEIINNYELSIFSFGDLVRVPGSRSTLMKEKSKGKKVNICYSPSSALDFAEENPGINVIFIAIGFETTIPLTSVIIKRAAEKNLKNFFIFCTHKIIPPALDILLSDENIKINGLLLPGHVSAIIGTKAYKFISEKYKIPGVVSGFEPLDILTSIKMILSQIEDSVSMVENEYIRVVKEEGNPFAIKEIYEVFELVDSIWRGLGNIAKSGLKIKEKYANYDAKIKFPIGKVNSREPGNCRCGDILKGAAVPFECELFAKACTPENPIGACMVSSEGTCAAYFKFERYRNEKL
ncbi:MAG: hydrogenase formation protein HypD [Actinobacteria bacterium]|nr:hydrogenase formation protein HypD [Actinomycetota bacterium]